MTTKKHSVDGLVNVASGLGVGKAKRDHNQFTYAMLNQYQQLEAAYSTNWIAKRICDVPAADTTREWRRIKSDGAEQIHNYEDELCVQQMVKEALIWARLYGGSAIVMITDQDLTKPLNLNRIKKGSLKNLLVFDRWDLGTFKLNTWDVLSPNYLFPETYNIRGGSLNIHWSHVIRFTGELLPRRLLQQTQGWGDSVLRKCIDDVADMVAAKDGIAELMQEANVDVLTRNNLSDELTTDQDDAIIKRYSLFSQMKSNIQMALLDGEEQYDRKTLNLSGVAPIIEQFITWISGAAGMPVTKLFGTAAKGLNATGEGDKSNYYDEIRGIQTGSLAMSMRQLDEVLVRSALGTFPKQFDYIWNPLEQSNEVDIANAELLRAQKNRIYLEDQIITTSQVQRNLQSSEEYQFDDDQINELEEMEQSTEFENMGQSTQEYVDSWMDNVGSTFASVKLTKESAKRIYDYVKSIGIDDGISPDDLHVTLMYSRDRQVETEPRPNDIYQADIGDDYKIMGNDPWRALIAPIVSKELVARHEELKRAGGVHSYDEFKPHLSLKYSPSEDDLQKLIDNPLPTTMIELSGEKFEPVK